MWDLSTTVQHSLVSRTTCCGHLSQTLGSKLIFPGNASYGSVLNSYWSQQETSLNPSCVLIPSTPNDISHAVSTLNTLPSCHFAIKGQGHAPAAGFANVDGGLTIDMSDLKSISVSEEHKVAQIGAGASWLDVYLYLDNLGLAVAGGRNGAVGVGGLTLGGGISHFSPRVGFTCDTVVNFELVLPSGKLVNANATSRPDLFRALKGGGNNFGIVTRFDIQAFPQGKILAGSLIHTVEQREAVFQAFSEIAGSKDFDLNTSLVTAFIYNSTTKAWIVSNGVVYTQPMVNPPVFRDVFEIPSISNSVAVRNYSAFADEGKGLDPKFNWFFYTGTYGVSATLMSRMFDALNETLSNFDIPGGITWSIAFEPLPSTITKHGDLNGGNSLGTGPRDGNAFIILLSPLWKDTASNPLVEKTARDLGNRINRIAQNAGLLHRFQYMNYANPSQDPIRSYGQGNVEFLKAMNRKYDPKGVFQKQTNGGFKILGSNSK